MEKQVKIMPCLDMQNGRVVKGVHFVDIKDAGDPVQCARAYCAAGADELAVLDAGADKVSTSSAAFRNPDLIPAMVKEFGAQKVTVAIDVDVNPALPSG